ncbi:MAG: 3-oxoacyl-[acyl-carrier-protein] reductase [Bdellovibrionales bacterium]|nr:3-oxoacyl-[acyl-carrier-protein] reductase [Bdellovibrionales bacterium]
MTSTRPLGEHVALVTGGSRGIGRAVCERLADAGATIVVNYARNSAAADEVVQTILDRGGRAEAVQFDVGNAESVDAAIKKVLESHQRIDVLVNNAGIVADALLVRTKEEDWQRVIDVNLSGAFYCSKAVAKSMMKARQGRIVNISSVIGQMGNAGQAAYSASKAGLIGLTKSLARELASRGVTANAIAPGYIETEMTDVLDEGVKQSILEQIPAKRLGSAVDIAETVLFLSSPGAAYITGQVIAVNGGMYM